MRSLLSSFLALLSLTSASHYKHQSNGSPTAVTCNGTTQGRYLEEFHQDLFLGVPFAEAPRLDNPRPISQRWKQPFDATKYGTTCYGLGSNKVLNLTQGEDCLNLNVVRPTGYAHDSLPVLVWIYGGGFTQGSNADPMWNLSYIVQTSVENEQPIIAVSINYRLSFLGFPVGNETLEAGVANLGLKDQRIALQWVQENIAAFGGDPNKVTAWGESAGGASTAWQLISYGGTGSDGLFRAAIMTSGTMFGVDSPKFTYTLQAQYDSVVNQTGCSSAADTLQCLRTVPINDLYAAEDNLTSIGPVIDGDFIRREPVLELDAGNVHRVPIMVGANADEGLFVVTLIGSPNTTAEIRPLLSAILPALSNDTLDAVLAAYPQDAPAPPYSLAAEYPWCAAMEAANLTCTPEYRRTAAILGDWFADAGRRYMARKWSELGLPTYSFRFAADPTGIPIRYWTNLGPGFAEHGVDLAYGFRLPGGFTTPIDYYPPVKKVHSHEYLSRVIASKVVSFAHSLDPNSYDIPHAPSWPQYASSSPRNYLYNASVEEVDIHIEADTYREDGIEIWLSHILQAYYNEDAPHTGSLG